VVRFPEIDDAPDPKLLLPDPDDVERLVLKQLGGTSLFAAKFREAAARALLLPRRRIGGRTPLWQQRKRAADLLAVASRFGSFPIVLEAYRECLRDLFDLPALVETLRAIHARQIRVTTVDSTSPSPFASALLFGYVANYLYEGDAPLAERRAQALAIDPAQLRALLGDAELRELLDTDAIDAVESLLQHRDPTRQVKSVDSLHDLLLRIGDLTADDIAARAVPEFAALATAATDQLVQERRAVWLSVAGERRLIAAEDASRYRDALGTPLPQGLPDALLASVRDPVGDLVMRYARTHGPFTTRAIADRFGLGRAVVDETLQRLAAANRVLEGEFLPERSSTAPRSDYAAPAAPALAESRPGGTEREWCEPGVLAQIRRRSLAKLRKEVEPVEPAVLGRLVTTWQGVTRKRRGLDPLLDVVESLEAAPLPASLIESEILPARIDEYVPGDLDTLLAAGEVVWCGLEPLGERDGRIALFLTDHLPKLWRPRGQQREDAEARRVSPPPAANEELGDRELAIIEWLRAHGASFFTPIHEAVGGGYPGETVDALWTLVWSGLVTNDSWQALRAYVGGFEPQERRSRPIATGGRPFRSRRQVPPAGEGRWSLMETRVPVPVSPTEWSTATAQQLLARYGVITREVATAEGLPGGFSAVYDVLKALEDSGRIRRGYFVSGVGGAQFALPAALDLLRSLRDRQEEAEAILLAATDPANPYGVTLPWPESAVGAPEGGATGGSRGPTRSVGAQVVIVDGQLAAYLGRGRQLFTYLPDAEPDRSRVARALASRLADIARTGEGRVGGLLIGEVDGVPATDHALAPYLVEAGFVRSALGFQVVRERPRPSFERKPGAPRWPREQVSGEV
jgi:ATP-dependent Lhr-like helicase